MTERNCSIKITGKEGEYLQITDMNDKYKSQVHESIITDNNYEVIDNVVKVSKDFFNHWFKKDIEAEAKRNSKLFYSNIPLFWENRKMILKEPRYYSIVTPEYFGGTSIGGGFRITLNALLQIWEKEKIISAECPNCGGKSVVYRFGGSSLSGCVVTKAICTRCGKKSEPPPNGSLDQLLSIRTRKKYSPIEPMAKPHATIEELVDVCKNERRRKYEYLALSEEIILNAVGLKKNDID